jgi:mannosyltransferase
MSVVFAVLAVPACAWAAWPFSARAGVLAAGLAAFSPFVGVYADETRMYSLAFMLAALATGAFVRAFDARRSRRWAGAFGALTALLCLTHGWGVFFGIAAAGAVSAALVLGPQRRRLALDALLAAAVAAVLFGPWLPTLLFQVAHTGAPWSHRPSGRSLVRAGSRMLGGRAPETVLLVVATGGLLAAARGSRDERRSVVAVAVLAIGTVVVAYGASRAAHPAWALRYLTVPLAPLLVGIGAGLDRAGAAGVLATLAVCLLFWAGTPSPASLSDKSNVAEMASVLGGDLPAGTLVASPQPEQVPVLARYLPASLSYVTPLGVQRDAGVVDWIDALPRLRASRVATTLRPALSRLRPGQRVLLVSPRFGRPDAPWTREVARVERRWRHWLVRDRRLVLVGRYAPGHYASRATVAGFLYQRLARPERAARRVRASLALMPRPVVKELMGALRALVTSGARRRARRR